jgi:predicted N-acetyltransferase YhbS
LRPEHRIEGFDCGQSALNDWLGRYALPNQQAGAATTFVVCDGDVVVGYYSLAVGAVEHAQAPARVKKGLARHPIPVMVLARLAVDVRYQGQKICQGLQNALLRTVQLAEQVGIRAILVHAEDSQARRFYERFDFESSPLDPLQLLLLVKDARKVFGSRSR